MVSHLFFSGKYRFHISSSFAGLGILHDASADKRRLCIIFIKGCSMIFPPDCCHLKPIPKSEMGLFISLPADFVAAISSRRIPVMQ